MLSILSYLFNFIQTLTIGVLLDEYLQTNYPEVREKCKNVVINQSYNAIYLYSKLEIMMNKCKPYVNKILNEYPVLKKIINYNAQNIEYNVEFVLDGKVVYKTTKENLMDSSYNMNYNGAFDFIIYSEDNRNNNDTNNDGSNNNMIHRKIIKTQSFQESDFVCEKSQIKFILCEFLIGDKKFKVDFTNSNNNYYVVNNIIDIHFLKYFLQKYYSEHVKDIDFNLAHDFKINIIDHNINAVILDKQNNIKVAKENYELLKKD